MTTPILDIKALTAGYGKTTIISDVNISVYPGARLALIGRNGVGKTTLFKTVMGLCPRSKGEVIWQGRPIDPYSTNDRAALGLGYVPQTRDIFPSLTVEENLIAGLKKRAKTEIEQAYDWFPRLAQRRRNLGNKLSGGEQQMLSIARALLGRPKLLLLDEPLEGLAPLIRDELTATISRLGDQEDLTVVMIEQHLQEAFAYAQDVVIMDRGQIVYARKVKDLQNEPEILERYVGLTNAH